MGRGEDGVVVTIFRALIGMSLNLECVYAVWVLRDA